MRLPFLVGGTAVLSALLWVLMQQDLASWPPQTWLQLAVGLVLVVVNGATFTLMGRPTAVIARRAASLGLSLVSDGVYTVVALGGLIAAARLQWSFESSLLFQAAALGVLLLWLLVGRQVDVHAVAVQRTEARGFAEVDALRAQVRRLHRDVREALHRDEDLVRRWDRVVDDIAFLYPTTGADGAREMGQVREQLDRFLAAPDADRLTQLEAGIRERKARRADGDYQGFL
ncbi:MAG: hypothetical protein FJ200_01910 [Gemmatimonadetes bacterium]|nr:hypothetical protein [Gemmatimonadota bacterium]